MIRSVQFKNFKVLRDATLPLTLETQRAAKEAQRLSQNLSLLENLFPAGFGTLVQDLRSWLPILTDQGKLLSVCIVASLS